MLIVQIIKKGKTKYYGCASFESERLDDEGNRRIKMFSPAGIKRISDIGPIDSVTLLNDFVML